MRKTWIMLLVAVMPLGCTLQDTNPKWDPPAEYPQWAYDAPFYYRPSADIKPLETVGAGIPVYYVSGEDFFVLHPDNYQPNGSPRMAVFLSGDEGRKYDRIGYYGVEQTHFLAHAERDGVYWIRFVGPSQSIPDVPPPQPHRVFVVDTKAPTINVTVQPSPWDDEKKRTPHVYSPGDEVKVSWAVADPNIDKDSLRLGVCFSQFPDNILWSQMPEPLPPIASCTVRIPSEAAARGGLRFRIVATDKSGNMGMGFTDVMQVAGAPAVREPSTRPALANAQNMRPAAATGGWPMPGAFLRGDTAMLLTNLPATVSDYDRVTLQFTADNGRSWRSVATDIRPGQSVKWTVPLVTSRMCHIRLVAARPGATAAPIPETQPGYSSERPDIVLRQSQNFTVSTLTPPVMDGPMPAN